MIYNSRGERAKKLVIQNARSPHDHEIYGKNLKNLDFEEDPSK